MTEQEVMTLLVGRELDAAVAKHVMGWKLARSFAIKTCGDWVKADDDFYTPIPANSTDITFAMSALCHARGTPPAHFTLSPRRDGQGYLCHVEIDNGYVGFGETISEAICRCCLLLAVTRKKQLEVKAS